MEAFLDERSEIGDDSCSDAFLEVLWVEAVDADYDSWLDWESVRSSVKSD